MTATKKKKEREIYFLKRGKKRAKLFACENLHVTKASQLKLQFDCQIESNKKKFIISDTLNILPRTKFALFVLTDE